ncbi:interferon alpha/beta receptor 2-like isoform 2-T2 [Polymixia lowei]
MGLWIPLLLHLYFVVGSSLPAPLNVALDSFNMDHALTFLPGPGTPTGTLFRVHVLRLRRKGSWKPVAGCLDLTASQACDLTRAFRDPMDQYRARVQAYTPSQTSNWTFSELIHPVSDTVLGPPSLSVSGCGNCLLLQVSSPETGRLQQSQQLQQLYRKLVYVVRRTRDGAEFSMSIQYEKETVLQYLQPGVEYCVTVTVTTSLNPHSVPSKPHCAFTSPPPANQSVPVITLLLVFCVLGLLLIGLVVYSGHLTSKLPGQCLPKPLSSVPLQCLRGSSSEQLAQMSAPWPDHDGSTDCFLALHNPAHLPE